MDFWGAFLLILVFLLATLPFFSESSFFGLPIFKHKKSVYVLLLEIILCYGVFIVGGYLIEGYLGQNLVQGWAFYAVTFLLYLVAAFPAFAWRYLWK